MTAEGGPSAPYVCTGGDIYRLNTPTEALDLVCTKLEIPSRVPRNEGGALADKEDHRKKEGCPAGRPPFFHMMTEDPKLREPSLKERLARGNDILIRTAAEKSKKVPLDFSGEPEKEQQKEGVRVGTKETECCSFDPIPRLEGHGAADGADLQQIDVISEEAYPKFPPWLLVHPPDHEHLLPLLMRSFEEQLKANSMTGRGPEVLSVSTTCEEKFTSEIRNHIALLHAQLDLVLVILPKQNGEKIYAELKDQMSRGALSCSLQCVKTETLQKKGARAAAKLFDQMICKQEGLLWNHKASELHPTMVVGIHTPSSATTGLTVVSFSASFNSSYTKYLSSSSFIKSHPPEETAEPFAQFLRKALEHFRRNQEHARGPLKQNSYPARIIIYKSTVSEERQGDQEIKALTNVLRGVDARWASNVEVAFLVITSTTLPVAETPCLRGLRGDERGQETADKKGDLTNIHALTTIASGVSAGKTSGLCVPHLPKNSAAPVHYTVLYWQAGSMTASDLQTLTKRLSMLCQDQQGCVRVPAPLVCASKQCALYLQLETRNQSEINRAIPYVHMDTPPC